MAYQAYYRSPTHKCFITLKRVWKNIRVHIHSICMEYRGPSHPSILQHSLVKIRPSISILHLFTFNQLWHINYFPDFKVGKKGHQKLHILNFMPRVPTIFKPSFINTFALTPLTNAFYSIFKLQFFTVFKIVKIVVLNLNFSYYVCTIKLFLFVQILFSWIVLLPPQKEVNIHIVFIDFLLKFNKSGPFNIYILNILQPFLNS